MVVFILMNKKVNIRSEKQLFVQKVLLKAFEHFKTCKLFRSISICMYFTVLWISYVFYCFNLLFISVIFYFCDNIRFFF